MNFEKEFENAFISEFGNHIIFKNELRGAIWASKWMANRCANIAETMPPVSTVPIQSFRQLLVQSFRQLAKDL